MDRVPMKRIVINSANKQKELFKVYERNDGFIIIIKHGIIYEDASGEWCEIKQRRFSVHNSSQTDHNAIKETLELKNGKKIELYYKSSFIKNTTYAPIYMERCGDLESKRYDTKNKDKIIILDRAQLKKATLVYGLAITASDTSNRIWADKKWNCKILKIKGYDLLIYWTYLNVPALPSSDTCSHQTEEKRINKKIVNEYGLQSVTHKGMKKRELVSYANGVLAIFKNKYIERLKAEPESTPTSMAQAKALLNLNTKKPIINK